MVVLAFARVGLRGFFSHSLSNVTMMKQGAKHLFTGTPSTMSTTNKLVCHSVPCNVGCGSVSGAALVDRYFAPAPLEGAATAEQDTSSCSAVYAATFRGRGLLGSSSNRCSPTSSSQIIEGLQDEASPQGRVVEITDNDAVKTVAVWKDYYNWHHTHQPEQLALSSPNNRWQRSREWMEVARALHTPIPTTDSSSK